MCAARVNMNVNIYVHNYLYVRITHFKLGINTTHILFLIIMYKACVGN